jgi:hypothetical protein
MKNKHMWVTAFLIGSMINLIGLNQVRGQTSSDYKNNAFGLSCTGGFSEYDPKTEKQTICWSPSLWRNIGSRSSRGGTIYLGIDHFSKLRFKDNGEVFTTPSTALGMGLIFQNNVTLQWAGTGVRLGIGIPHNDLDENKLHFYGNVRIVFNIIDYEVPIRDKEWNIAGICIDIGGHGLVRQLNGMSQHTIWTMTYSVGVIIQMPNRD